MRTFLRDLGRVLPAASAMVILAACGDSTVTGPTAASTSGTTSATASGTQQSSPVIVTGTVADAAGRPLANVNLECMGDVQCRGLGDVTAQDSDHAVVTNANGVYYLMATDGSADGNGEFLLNANARNYEVAMQSVRFAERACSGQPNCTITVNFTLNAQSDPGSSSRR